MIEISGFFKWADRLFSKPESEACPVRGGESRKTLGVGHNCSCIFDNASKNNLNGQAISCDIVPRLYKSYNHCPSARPAHVAEFGPRAPLPSAPKQ